MQETVSSLLFIHVSPSVPTFHVTALFAIFLTFSANDDGRELDPLPFPLSLESGERSSWVLGGLKQDFRDESVLAARSFFRSSFFH